MDVTDKKEQNLLKMEDYLLFLSKDGGWHDIEGVKENTSLTERQIDKINEFLGKYNWIERKNSDVKVDEKVRLLFQ